MEITLKISSSRVRMSARSEKTLKANTDLRRVSLRSIFGSLSIGQGWAEPPGKRARKRLRFDLHKGRREPGIREWARGFSGSWLGGEQSLPRKNPRQNPLGTFSRRGWRQRRARLQVRRRIMPSTGLAAP